MPITSFTERDFSEGPLVRGLSFAPRMHFTCFSVFLHRYGNGKPGGYAASPAEGRSVGSQPSLLKIDQTSQTLNQVK